MADDLSPELRAAVEGALADAGMDPPTYTLRPRPFDVTAGQLVILAMTFTPDTVRVEFRCGTAWTRCCLVERFQGVPGDEPTQETLLQVDAVGLSASGLPVEVIRLWTAEGWHR